MRSQRRVCVSIAVGTYYVLYSGAAPLFIYPFHTGAVRRIPVAGRRCGTHTMAIIVPPTTSLDDSPGRSRRRRGGGTTRDGMYTGTAVDLRLDPFRPRVVCGGPNRAIIVEPSIGRVGRSQRDPRTVVVVRRFGSVRFGAKSRGKKRFRTTRRRGRLVVVTSYSALTYHTHRR